MVVTFYSFKGGVGRSMAMANIGHLLAQSGYHVLLCDWDLEAPGLERYLAEESQESEELEAAPGLIDLLREYKALLANTSADAAADGIESNDAYCKVGDLWLRRPSSFARHIAVNATGTLRLLTAGARGAQYAEYAETVQSFDWTEFYEQWAGGAYMDFVKRDLSKSAATAAARELPGERIPPGVADIVLVDSRTGVTEYGGVATHHLADLVVLLSGANSQNLQGTRRMADALGPQLVADKQPPIPVLPIRARIETAELELLNDFRERFDTTFTNHLPAIVGQPSEFFEASEIPYVPYYSFEERVITRGGGRGREPKLYKAYKAIADAIVKWGKDKALVESMSTTEAPSVAVSGVRATRSFGLVTVRAAFVDKAWADDIAHALSAAGLNVSTAPLAAPGTPNADPAAIVLLIGPATPDRWIRAQCECALKRSVLRPELKILPAVHDDADVAKTPYISRARVVRIGAGQQAAETILYELPVRSTVEGEPPNVRPFPGARTFSEDDARFFFGRDAEIARVEASVNPEATNWIRIDGPSGAGVSSFVQAGVIPAIRRVVGSRSPRTPLIANCRLSGATLEGLAPAIAAATGTSVTELSAALASTDGLKHLAATVASAGNLLVLVIDQLEEVVAVESASGSLLDVQLSLALAADAPFVLVTAMRSEFNDAIARRLTAIFQQAPLSIRCHLEQPTRGQMTDIMAAPARLAGLEWQRGLLEQIIDEVDREHVSLALVAAMLDHIWQHRSERQLTFAAYREFGSPGQHLAKELDERMKALSDADKERAKWLLLSLVTASGGRITRRLVAENDALAAAGGDASAARMLAELMRAPGVVRVDASGRIELAHDAIVQASTTLRSWIGAEQRRLQIRDELEALEAAFAKNEGPLPRGAQLAYFKEAAALSPRAKGFLDLAGATERRERRWRFAFIAATAAIVILLAGGWYMWRSAVRETEATQLAVESQRIAEERPLRSLSLAVRAAGLKQTPESESALRRVLGAAYPRTIVHHDGPIVDATLSADGSRLLTASLDGTAGIWDAKTGGRYATMQHGQPVRALSMLPDGGVATLTEKSCRVWTPSGASRREFVRNGGDLIQLATSADGRLVAAVDLKDKAPVWDVGNGSSRFLQASGASALHFRPDNTIVIASATGEIVNEDPQTGKTIGEPLHLAGVSPFSTALSNDGKVFAAAGTEGALVWPSFVTSSSSILLDGTQNQEVWSLILNRDGRWATGIIGGTVYVWDAKTGVKSWSAGDSIIVATINPNGDTIATGRADGIVHVWSRENAELKKTLRFHTSLVRQLRFSADGASLVSAGDDGAAIWDLLASFPDPATLSFDGLLGAAAALLPAGVQVDAKMQEFNQ